jgi:PBP1b-binding outer membrane lipoprotein LpoB
MIKIILSIAVITLVFSGCVGTLVNNDRVTPSSTSVAKIKANHTEEELEKK